MHYYVSARTFAKTCTVIISFLCPLYRWGNWGTERLHYTCPGLHKLGNGWVGIFIWVCVAPQSMLLNYWTMYTYICHTTHLYTCIQTHTCTHHTMHIYTPYCTQHMYTCPVPPRPTHTCHSVLCLWSTLICNSPSVSCPLLPFRPWLMLSSGHGIFFCDSLPQLSILTLDDSSSRKPFWYLMFPSSYPNGLDSVEYCNCLVLAFKICTSL